MGNEIKNDSIVYAGVTIPYGWCHSRRKTLGISIRPDKAVSVRVPMRTPIKDIEAFVTSKAEWVLKIWKKLDTQPGKQQQNYSRGSVFMYQGKEFRLEFTTGLRHSLLLHDGLMILATPTMPSEETVRKLITNWYRNKAVEIVNERAIACHQIMQNEGIPLPPVTLRSMKTRWGSYSYKTQRIVLNLNLVKTPPVCLDYVIIHELCHIKVRHHGPDFWRMVSRYVPDYLEVRKLLRKSGAI